MTDPMLDAIGVAETAVRRMLDTAAAVEAEASASLLRSETREEFLGHLDVAAIAPVSSALPRLVTQRPTLTAALEAFSVEMYVVDALVTTVTSVVLPVVPLEVGRPCDSTVKPVLLTFVILPKAPPKPKPPPTPLGTPDGRAVGRAPVPFP